MSRPSLSDRPRVLDLMGRGAGLPAAHAADVVWPCHVYRVTLPVRPPDAPNLFEDVVLRLLALGRADAPKLAALTCLPADLIGFILLRLQDHGLITRAGELTPRARTKLDERANAPPEYEGRYLFRERVGGQLLPVLWAGELRCEVLIGTHKDRLEVENGKHPSRHLRVIPPRAGVRSARPEVEDVLAVLRQHQRLNRHYALLKGEAPAPVVVAAGQINIVPHPESYLLRTQFLVPDGGTDVLVADPFGYGCSDVLDRVYRRLVETDAAEEEVMLRLKEKAAGKRVGTADAPGPTPQSHIPRHYPELRRQVNAMGKLLDECRGEVRSRDDESRIASKRQQFVQKCYNAVEWALRYCLDAATDDAQVRLLQVGTHADNAKVLTAMAGRIGFATDDLGRLLDVRPGRVRALAEGVVEMEAVLGVTIAVADANPLHPLRALATAMPDWLQYLTVIKRDRDRTAHGEAAPLTAERVELHDARTREAIRHLLPAALTAGATPAAPAALGEYEARLLARVALERRFGVQGFRLLGSQVAELLLGVERRAATLPSDGVVEASQVVGDLSAALEAVFRQVADALPGAGRPAAGPAAAAATRAREAGFTLHLGGLPRELATVNPDKVYKALDGFAPSLAAAAVAMLLRTPGERLVRAARAQPDYLLRIARLIQLRGHGNRTTTLPAVELQQLIQDIYTAIQMTLES